MTAPNTTSWHNSMPKEQRQEAFSEVAAFLRQGSRSEINGWLCLLYWDVETAPIVLTLSALRLTSLMRDNLVEWVPLRDELQAVLVARGLDAPAVLVGLLDP